MITVTQCAALAGLASNEMVLGVTPSARHHSLLASYLLNLGRGPVAVRTMIVADLRAFLDLGAARRAADLLIVLRFFLSKHPEAGYVPLRLERRNVVANSFLSKHLLPKNNANSIAGRRQPLSEKRDGRKSCACGN
jgi:hypothetical protein